MFCFVFFFASSLNHLVALLPIEMFPNTRSLLIALTWINVSLVYGDNKQECGSKTIQLYKDLASLNNCTIILGNLVIAFGLSAEEETYTAEELNSREFPLR